MTIKVGTMVRVTVKNNSPWVINAPATEKYEGQVVANPKWISDDHISMTTGLAFFPMRTLSPNNIVKVETIDGKALKLPPVVKTQDKSWIVKGSKGDEYTVTNQGKVWNCTCKGFQFRRSCVHIVDKQNQK